MIHKILYTILLITIPFLLFGQRNSDRLIKNLKVTNKSKLVQDVVIGNTVFEGSAILTITSSSQGMLAPRMNTAARDNIGSPADGLLIYNNQTNQYEFFESTWKAVGGGNSIYDGDGSLTADPTTVTMGTKVLTFASTGSANLLKVDGNNDLISVGGRIEQTGLGSSVFLGFEAGLNDDLTGNLNVAVGHQAMKANTTGNANVAVGWQSMLLHTEGVQNTAIGNQSLVNTTTGIQNTAIGYQALRDNTTDGSSVAIGWKSLLKSDGGTGNTAVGTSSLRNLETGDFNTAVGFTALTANIIGNSNTGVGFEALLNATGNDNTAIGKSAGNDISFTGSDNILIGSRVEVPVFAGNNQLTIGNLIFGIGLDGTGQTISTGSIGVGLTSPSARFTVKGINAASSDTAFIVTDNVDTELFIIVNDGHVIVSSEFSTTKKDITLGVAAVTFSTTSNMMQVTGDGGGNTIATITGAISGQYLIMIFVDNKVIITDDNGHGANTIDLSAAFSSLDDTVLHLIYDGVSWYETSRSVN